MKKPPIPPPSLIVKEDKISFYLFLVCVIFFLINMFLVIYKIC